MTDNTCPHYSASLIRHHDEAGYGVYECDRCGDRWTEDDAR